MTLVAGLAARARSYCVTRVAIPDDDPPVISDSSALVELRGAAGVEIDVMTSRPEDEVDLARRIAGAHTVLSIRASSRFSYDVMSSVSELKHIAVWGTGVDNVDLDSARRLDITVTNTPGTATDAVAEHALALTLSLARRIPELDVRVRAGDWPRGMLTQLAGKRMGIVGTGEIGMRTARLARGIGMDVIAWTMNPSQERAQRLGLRFVELDDLLESSDVVSLHVRLSDETNGMIGPAELGLMKPTALLINTARGALVDEAALTAVLADRSIGGAALDVFVGEPLVQNHPLVDLPNVILSPHTAGTTLEALSNGLHMAVENVLAFLAGRPQNVVA